MPNITFTDRQSIHPNRKKLTIVSQVGNELIVDVEMADQPSVVGTPINASVLNSINQKIPTFELNGTVLTITKEN